MKKLPSPITAVVVLALTLCGLAAPEASAGHADDEFIRGYATALIVHQYEGSFDSLMVSDGVIFLRGLNLPAEAQPKLTKQLEALEGVDRVVIVADGESADRPAAGDEHVSAASALPSFLPRSQLFQPLLADPRWPHFSAAYQRYSDDDQLNNVGATSFGEMFGIYRFGGPGGSVMEIGIQAGVFAIFDLDAESMDLINADYLVGIPLTTQIGDLTNMTRLFHQSSHLGDEFLLRGRTDNRVNLSYEAVSSLFSYQLPAGFRIYGGGAYIFHKDPSDLDPWSTQFGLEQRSPFTFLGGALRPVAAVDIQNRQESDWDTDVSARAGVQFENPDFLERRLQLLLEYYRGKSPNGQFYDNSIEHVGVGVHFFFD